MTTITTESLTQKWANASELDAAIATADAYAEQFRARWVPLAGSEKQVAWAREIREQFAVATASHLAKLTTLSPDAPETALTRANADRLAWNAPSAEFWINNKAAIATIGDRFRNNLLISFGDERLSDGY